MKKIFIFALSLFVTLGLNAETPAEALMSRYEDVKGAKSFEVSGVKMNFARPVLKKFPIGPMSDAVDEIVILRMDKASEKDRSRFLDDMNRTLGDGYIYYGKSQTNNGLVDVYVHLSSEDCADELVIYNPEIYVLNVLAGSFPVKELLRLDKRND